MNQLIKLITFALMVLAFSEFALAYNIAERPTVQKCMSLKSKKGKLCVINSVYGKVGSVVTFYNKDRYWRATGTIAKRSGKKAYVVLKNTQAPILRNYIIEIGVNSSVNSSFSKAFDY